MAHCKKYESGVIEEAFLIPKGMENIPENRIEINLTKKSDDEIRFTFIDPAPTKENIQPALRKLLYGE